MPIYTPANLWNDASCPPSNCHILSPTDSAFRQNYHAATYIVGGGARTAQLSFKGTAIYVFFILANNVPNAWTETFCNFILDKQSVEAYHHSPTSSPNYQYNALVYSKTNLANTDHTLLISADGYQTMSFINFDYAIYTYDDGVDTTMQSSTTTSMLPHVTPVTETAMVFGTPVTTTIDITQSESPTPSFSRTTSSSSSSLSSIVTISSSPTSHNISVIGNLLTLGTIGTALTATASSSSSNGTNTSAHDSNGADNNITAHKPAIGAIAGGVIGGVALILIIISMLYVLCRRKRRAYMDLLSTEHKPATPIQQPALTPFTSFSPGKPDIETKALEAMPLFSPIGKRREVMKKSELGYTESSLASITVASRSEAAEILQQDQRQNLIRRQISRLKKSLDASGSLTSESVSFNQAVEAEIERLQEQLNSDWALGLSDEPPPEYSRV
ncbi:hypothetical protein C0995_011014 [Termitomyces sp. Mi166|nr:hypothetical protein C0995_011014 [Termitomyces sp. Mi166\